MNSDDQPSASATAVHRSPGQDRKQVVRIQHLTKRFRRNDGSRVDALADVSLTVYAGELLVLLGPSGCGKTTLLRSIAGLEQPDSGSISLGGTEVFNIAAKINVPVERRDVAMVAQSYALWPNMTVLENIAYPLRSRPRAQRPPKAEILARVQELMETAGIAEIGRQHPSSISGGQQQRVALCRALVGDCQVVLFDEPLSNVDARVREQLRRDLVEIQRKLKFTGVFVTHDRHEAMEIADEIAVFQNGQIAQQGAPAALYRSPASVYVADFLGPTNSVDALLPEPAAEGSVATAETALGTVRGIVRAPGERCVAVWRPERMRLSCGEQPLDGANWWSGVIERSCFYGTHTECFVTTVGPTLRVSVTGDVSYPAGAKVQVAVDTRDVVFLTDAQAGQP